MAEHLNKIDYIELNVKDIDVAKNLYAAAFGWSFTDYGPQYSEFNDGRLKGGLTTTAPVSAKGGPLIILYSDDLEACQQRVEDAGGIIEKAIFSFPGGRRFHFIDPNGYELAVWSER